MAEYEKKVRELLAQYGCYFIRRGRGDHDICIAREKTTVSLLPLK